MPHRKRKQRKSNPTTNVAEPNPAALQNWKRVASTHRLEDLLGQRPPHVPNASLRALLGGMLMTAALLAAGLAAAALVKGSIVDETLASGSRLYYVQATAAWVPVTAIYVFVNWFSNKLFKHNT